MGNTESSEYQKKKFFNPMYNWILSFPNKEYEIIDNENSKKIINTDYDSNKQYIDLRNKCPPILDIGKLPIHTVSTIASILNYQLTRNKLTVFPPSLLFIYKNISFYEDVNSLITYDCIFKSIEKYGFCSEIDLSSEISNIKDISIPLDIYKRAESYKFINVYRIGNSIQLIKHFLQNDMVLAIGFVLYTDLNKISNNLWIPDFNKNNKLGRMTGMVVGYLDSKQEFIIQLGLGKYFGTSGYITMPYEYLSDKDLVPEIYYIDLEKSKIEGSLTQQREIISLNNNSNNYFI